MAHSKLIGALAISALVLLVAACIPGLNRLEPGYAAVKIDYSNNGARTDIPAGGYINYNPVTERVAEYPVGQQSLVMARKAGEGSVQGDDSVEVRVGGIPIHFDTTLFWRIDPNRIADMFQLRPGVALVGKTVNDGIDGIVVRRIVRGTMQDAGATFTAYTDVYGTKRQEYQDNVSKIMGCPTSAANDPLAAMNPLTRTADPNSALGREFVICDKLQLGEVYLDDAQQKAISDYNNAITAVQTSGQAKLAAENTAAASAAPVIANAQAEATAISLRENALAVAPHVLTYDIGMAQANHPALVQGGSSQVQIPLGSVASPTPQIVAQPTPAPATTPTPAH